MSDLQTLAATLLANFATVRIPRCESLWISSVPNPSPKHRYRLLSRALAGETLIMNCHRQHLRYRLLEAGPSRLLRPDRGRWTRWMAATLLLPGPGGHQRIVQHRCGGVRSWQCRDIRSRAVRHAPARPTGAYWSSRICRMDGGTGTRESVVLCRHTVPSCIPIMRMVCLSELDSVIAFGIDEARRNLRPIKS